MSKIVQRVTLSPLEALSRVRDAMQVDLVHDEEHRLNDGLEIGTLIFEKYFMRSRNRAALIVIADNFQGHTEVRAIGTASSEGLIFNFDWGAADSFVGEVVDILEPYIVR